MEGFSQNKGDNLNFQKFNDFLNYFCIFSQIVLKFGTEHLHNRQKSVFLNIVYFWFMLNLHKKIMNTNDFWSCFAIFSSKIGIKSKVDNIWKVYFRFFAQMCSSTLPIYKWLDSKCKSSSKIHDISENSNYQFFFYRKPEQISKLRNDITFERCGILKFCKKHLLPCKEIFHISLTLFFWPWPPIALNRMVERLP